MGVFEINMREWRQSPSLCVCVCVCRTISLWRIPVNRREGERTQPKGGGNHPPPPRPPCPLCHSRGLNKGKFKGHGGCVGGWVEDFRPDPHPSPPLLFTAPQQRQGPHLCDSLMHRACLPVRACHPLPPQRALCVPSVTMGALRAGYGRGQKWPI